MAISGLSAAVNQEVDKYAQKNLLTDLPTHSKKLVTNFLTGTTTQLVRVAVYGKGKLDFASLAADAFGNALGDAVVASAQPRAQPQVVSQRVRDLLASGEVGEVPDLSEKLVGQFLAARDKSYLVADASGSFPSFGPDALESNVGELRGAVKDFLASVKAGANDLARSALSRMDELQPGLSKAFHTVTETLPELIDAAKQTLRDEAGSLAIDAAMAVGGVLLAKFSGGASLAMSWVAAARRGEKVAQFVESAYGALRGAERLIENLPTTLAAAKDLVKGGVLDVVSKAVGTGGASVEDIVAKLGPAGARGLPGIGHAGIDKALSDAMVLGDRLLKVATDGFVGKSPLLSAITNAVYRHGDVAEFVTGFVLEHSGLFSSKSAGANVPAMGPIQNRSGHGIDWVGRALTGQHAGSFVAFEVKAGLNRRARGLDDGQTNLREFMRTRLERAEEAEGHWAHAADGTSEFAGYVQREMRGRTWQGYLIQHHMMRTQPEVTWKPWSSR